MTDFPRPAQSRADILARLHLHAVLPALADLVAASPEAGALAAGWNFSLRLQIAGGPAATLVSNGGRIAVHPDASHPAALTLLFFSSAHLNRTFLHQKTPPPLPTAGFWRLAKVRTFTRLTDLLDQTLQPAPAALDDPSFRALHLRLLFRVLIGAIPVVGAGDGACRHSLAHTPGGVAEIRAPALNVSGWVSWSDGQLNSGIGPAAQPADVRITFCDLATADAALLGHLDPNAAVGLGTVEVRGLVPLADGLSVVMDRVETYLKPDSAAPVAALPATAGAAAAG